MQNLKSLGLIYSEKGLLVLDQQKLPQTEDWLRCENVPMMIEMIQSLKIRGAPLIGVGAALSLADFAVRTKPSVAELTRAAHALREARPTAVNLMIAMDRMLELINPSKPLSQIHDMLLEKAVEIFNEDVQLCENMANHGAALIDDGDQLLTHCNAGGLATVGIGTAVGVIRRAHEQKKKIHVYVDETRPLLQGARLTAWELKQQGIPYTLICDNMAASLMAKKKIQKIFVGADRVAVNGDFANKIGTYSLAVLAHHHGVKMYSVAPYTTIDPDCESGEGIPVEQRKPEEVRGAIGSFGQVTWSPSDAPAYNPAFDVTPVSLVEGLVFDFGYFTRAQLQNGELKLKMKREKK